MARWHVGWEAEELPSISREALEGILLRHLDGSSAEVIEGIVADLQPLLKAPPKVCKPGWRGLPEVIPYQQPNDPSEPAFERAPGYPEEPYAIVRYREEKGRNQGWPEYEPPERVRCKWDHGRANGQCKNNALRGGEYCRAHDKKLAASERNPGDRYARYIPKELLHRYESLMESPGYISSREEINLVTLRIQELMERLDEGESPEARVTALERVRGILADLDRHEDPDRARALLYDLQEYLEHEKRMDEAHDQKDKSLLVMVKLKETEIKRMVAAGQMLTIQESVALVRKTVALVEEYITDQLVRERFVRELHLLLDRRA